VAWVEKKANTVGEGGGGEGSYSGEKWTYSKRAGNRSKISVDKADEKEKNQRVNPIGKPKGRAGDQERENL